MNKKIVNAPYIPINRVIEALKKSEISIEESQEIFKENIVRYYKSKMIYYLRYKQWDDFFYVYETAKMLGHGTDTSTHIIAAHGHIMAYSNVEKAKNIIKSLPETSATKLTMNILLIYEDLKSKNIHPASPDWSIVLNLCTAAALGTTPMNKWKILENNPRTPWHFHLRPWKYPEHFKNIKDDFRYKQQEDK
ncbi:hypothetical protein SteCoe_18436 [Stentor coeruleus]|uniref:Uncharacterized protein n=1 Tax=Stentor coeruleus TaxID=5963 RepID=A0A1R2BWJ8_9CILI|nr:hypothetical protein SteCoe_18436 [Stentor coeruleus]